MERVIQQVDEIHQQVTKIMAQKETVWLDVPETCRFLKISSRTLQNYRNDGLIPFSQINSKIYFREQDLQKFLESHMVFNSSNINV